MVALLFFYTAFLRAPQNGMPAMPDVLVGLTSVAAAGYVGKKALTGPAVISDVEPASQVVGQDVTLVTSGIFQSGDDVSRLGLLFGSVAGRVAARRPLPRRDFRACCSTPSVPDSAAGKLDVAVSRAPQREIGHMAGFKVEPWVPARPTRRSRIAGTRLGWRRQASQGRPRSSSASRSRSTAGRPRRRSIRRCQATTVARTVPANIISPGGADVNRSLS